MQLLNTLYVTLPDRHLRLDNDTLRLLVGDETHLRVPLHHLGAVVCFGHSSVSLPLMHRLADDGITLVLLDAHGRFKARLEGATGGNVLLRQAQHRCSGDAAFRLALARRIVAGKLRNQRHVLLRGARDAKQPEDAEMLVRAAKDLAASLRALPGAATLNAVRGVEGEAARGYFAATTHLLRPDLRASFAMHGRTRRPPRDRLALSLVNRLQVQRGDFAEREGGAVMLDGDARKAVVVAFQERKQDALATPCWPRACRWAWCHWCRPGCWRATCGARRSTTRRFR